MNDEPYYEALAVITGLPVDEVRARIAAGAGLSLTTEQIQALLEPHAERELEAFWEAADEGEYVNAVSRLGSFDVAKGIVMLDSEYGLSADEAREILRNHWTRADSPRESVEAILRIFYRAGYVSDASARLTGELTVYRGTFGDDPSGGISWTLSSERAHWFARRLGPGGAVWSATVDADDVLGYFTDRKEEEIIVDPSALRDVRRVDISG
jgi:hypothetical protein